MENFKRCSILKDVETTTSGGTDTASNSRFIDGLGCVAEKNMEGMKEIPSDNGKYGSNIIDWTVEYNFLDDIQTELLDSFGDAPKCSQIEGIIIILAERGYLSIATQQADRGKL